MSPGYFVAIMMTVFIVAEYFWKNKEVHIKEVVTIIIAALVAGVFAGLVVEGFLGLFRIFMQANAPESSRGNESFMFC
jgi:uncharacterized membrane protein YfcA